MNYDKRTKELEDRIADLELVIDYTDDGLHLLDKDGMTVLINRYCQMNEGLYFEEIKDKSMKQLQDEGTLSESATVKVLKTKKRVSLIQRVKSGKDMMVTGTPIFDEDGEIHRVMVFSRDITELTRLRKRLVETQTLYSETRDKLFDVDSYREVPPNIVCKSNAMQKVIYTATIVADVDSNILVTGESGTGKGVISRFIHDRSKRRNQPYIKIDCGSIPETLFESELFGYESGAFTGASGKGKIGLMELADGGTLFLDEIGELPMSCQAKLLRAIQDKEIIRVGGTKLISIDVRIISATNKDLLQMIEEEKFREDLYYRINVVPIKMPPLRERQGDIPDLIHRFVHSLCDKYKFDKRFSMDAIDVLMECEWKGNVRELENFIEMAVITSRKSLILARDLPPTIFEKRNKQKLIASQSGTLAKRIDTYEELILRDFIARKTSLADIAKELSIDVTTVRRKFKKYDIK